MSSAATQSTVLDNIKRMFAAITQGDMDTFRSYYTPDAVVWHNHDEAEQNLDEVCQGLSHLVSISNWLRYDNQVIYPAGSEHFVQHVLVADLKSGGTLRLPAMMHIETDGNGLITRLEEYFDSRATDLLR